MPTFPSADAIDSPLFTGKNYIIGVLMKWLRQGRSPYQTAVAMIGTKPGQRVLIVGASDGKLAAAIALVTGLNGRTLVVDRTAEAQTRVERAAADAGALVDFERATSTMLPLDAGAFDLAVVQRELGAPTAEPSKILAEAARVVRDGGRVLVIEAAPRQGVLSMLQRPARQSMESASIRDLLASLGLRAARVLAEADGAVYVEAVKRV
jgi:ubiquinone/menaquinone biosynthesis C-methylase UbiE